MRPHHDATEPDADTCEPGEQHQAPMLGFIILWSAAEPDRMGEIAFLTGSQSWCIGRGSGEDFAHFARQLPGEPVDNVRRASCLQGKTMSARHLELRVDGDTIRMKQIGSCLTLVNSNEQSTATLRPGDTILIRGVALLLCVRRPRILPALGTFRGLPHSFGEPDGAGIVGESLAAWRLRLELAEAARSPFHVLIQGNSGAGKESSARAVHQLSERRHGLYVASSAAVFTETLVESKLFGQAKDYPNRGDAARKGLFDSADRGTLFLDEICECPEIIQAALLRALDNGEFTPLGEHLARHADVRVVVATNRELKLLRPELFLRFKKRVRVPDLSERREDIPLLIRFLALKRAVHDPELMGRFLYTGPTGRMDLNISGRVVDYLVRHPLTGNVRELESLLDGFITKSTGNQVRLPPEEETESVAPVVGGKPSEARVRAALKRAGENVREAAKELEMSSTSLYRLIKDYRDRAGECRVVGLSPSEERRKNALTEGDAYELQRHSVALPHRRVVLAVHVPEH